MDTRQPRTSHTYRSRYPLSYQSGFPSRRARSGRARHAKKEPTLLALFYQAFEGLTRAVRPLSAAARGRLASLRAAARRQAPRLAAATGVLVVVLSVYLVQQGLLVPSSVPFGPGEQAAGPGQETASPAPASTEPGEQPGGEPASTTQPSSPSGSPPAIPAETPAASGEPSDQPSATGSGDTSPPVMESEGTATGSTPGSASGEVGPLSRGESLKALQAPASGKIIRPYGTFFYSATFADWRYHSGVDIALATGDTVRAALGGMVARVSYTALDGWRVEVSHGFGLATVYSHLGAVRVEEGQPVETGQVVGTAGTPGLSEADLGVHLHFELRVDNAPSDPSPYLGS